MIFEMLDELKRFALAIVLIFLNIVLVGKYCSGDLQVQTASMTQITKDIFNTFTGNQNYSAFSFPAG